MVLFAHFILSPPLSPRAVAEAAESAGCKLIACLGDVITTCWLAASCTMYKYALPERCALLSRRGESFGVMISNWSDSRAHSIDRERGSPEARDRGQLSWARSTCDAPSWRQLSWASTLRLTGPHRSLNLRTTAGCKVKCHAQVRTHAITPLKHAFPGAETTW